MGDGNCAEVTWTFLGMSIPQMTLLLFIAMIVAFVTAFIRAR
jgi:disulfide bond formation protein DsbB